MTPSAGLTLETHYELYEMFEAAIYIIIKGVCAAQGLGSKFKTKSVGGLVSASEDFKVTIEFRALGFRVQAY